MDEYNSSNLVHVPEIITCKTNLPYKEEESESAGEVTGLNFERCTCTQSCNRSQISHFHFTRPNSPTNVS